MKTWDAIYQEWKTDDGQIHAQRMGLLIRCKDCTHWHTSYCPMAYLEYELGRGNEPMDFCSLAERKEE